MKQYIYGNIEKKGYIYLSSDPKFFLDPQKAQVMPHLVCYDTTCRHADLLPGDHQCYWMLTTNLNIPSEQPHLFLQASGFHPDRGATYAHGFFSDSEDTDLYGPRFLDLMKASFKSGQDIAELKVTYFPQALSDLPQDTHLAPMQLPVNTLEILLDTLLQGRKLILRLPQAGRAAMRSSRELLLSLYARLPYALRQTNGFVTGMSSHKILDTTNTLPAAITIYLMDNDAATDGLPPLGTEYFTLSEDGELSNSTGRPLPPVRSHLAAFLASESPEKLDDFFCFCQQLTTLATGNFVPSTSNYELFLFFYTLGSQTYREITDEQIRLCAANLYGADAKIKNLKSELYRRVAGVLSPQRLSRYLCDAVTGYEDLVCLGIPDPQEQKAILAGTISKVTDTHAALTLRLAQTYYTCPEDIQALLLPLTDRFLELAFQEKPCLTEDAPTAQTVQSLEMLSLEDTSGSNIKEQLINQVHENLRRKKAAVLSKYEENRRTQLQQGMEAIGSWPLACTPDSLSTLYAQLENSYYLHAELMPEWNTSIGKKITAGCSAIIPETIGACSSLLENAEAIQRLFQSKGGVFSCEQEAIWGKQTAFWRNICDLSKQHCTNVHTLLNLFVQVDTLQVPPKIAEELKRCFTAQVPVHPYTDEEICCCARRLIQNNANSLERELLLPVLTDNLSSFAPSLPLVSIKARLAIAKQMQDALLFQQKIDFRPWDCKDSVGNLLNALTALERYGPGKAAPNLDSPSLRRWASENLQSNLHLMYLLAKQDSCLDSKILDLLAGNYNIQVNQLEQLYLAGWSWQDLQAAGGGLASPAWQNALETVCPRWAELPAPLFSRPTHSSGISAVRLVLPPILLGLIALVPLSVFGALGLLSLPLAIWTAAILALGAASCFGAACLPLQPEQKKLLRRYALALLPGLLAVVTVLILILTSVL